jgi:hypothetical protein
MKLTTLYSNASGFSLDDACFIGLRFDEEVGFKRSEGESYLCQLWNGKFRTRYEGGGWFTGLWYSESRTAYFTESWGTAFVYPGLTTGTGGSRQYKLPGLLAGAWGLTDEFVLVWGDQNDTGVMYRWDGKAWGPMESPGPGVLDVHGISPELLVAVGPGGMISRWDGAHWHRVDSPTQSVLSAVYVASPDEMYAVGAGGRFLEGSVHGWSDVLAGPGPLFGVAKWKNEVWVGAAQHGLMKREGDKLVSIKPNIKAETMDARQDLVITCPDKIAGTADGKNFGSAGKGNLLEMLAGTPPGWRR